MTAIYVSVRLLHIVSAVVSFSLMFTPLVTRKGGSVHRRVGWVVVIAMTAAALTGVVLSGFWIAWPIDVGPQGEDSGTIRRSGLFLGLVGLITLQAVRQIVAAPRRKYERAPRPEWIDVAVPATLAIGGAAAVATGIVSRHLLLIVFGAVAVINGVGAVRFARRPLPARMAWWYAHMGGAMGAIIAATTAFLVLGGRRFMGDLVPPQWRWALWIGPSLVVVPLFQFWIASYRRRFESRAQATQPF